MENLLPKKINSMAIQEQELQHTYHSIVDNLQSLQENLTNLQLNNEI